MDYQMLITVLCTVGAFVVGYLAFKRERDNDVRTEASDTAVIRTKLDNISSGIDSIRIDIKANEKSVSDLSKELIRVEESSKQSHKRIDSLEKRLDSLQIKKGDD